MDPYDVHPYPGTFQNVVKLGRPMMQRIIDLHHDIFFFLILILVFLFCILIRALWHFHYKKNTITQKPKMNPAFFLVFSICFILVVGSHITIGYCDARTNSPPFLGGLLPPPQIPAENDLPQEGPGRIDDLLPEVPRLDEPLIPDEVRKVQLQHRFDVNLIGRNRIRDLAQFAGILEKAVLLEKKIEAALVFDGYAPDQILFRIDQIRGILFLHPTRSILLSERTLDRYLHEIEIHGTRQSVPYTRVVRAIHNHDLLL